jgi:CubicO group peptidase (beta-lactamase class C family)
MKVDEGDSPMVTDDHELNENSPFEGDISLSIEGWPRSEPERQGIDSASLVGMLDEIVEGKIDIDSMLLIRNGRLVMEAYRYPYGAETLHVINSCTKSILSALIGIAVGEGKIRDLDQRVVDFFPDRRIANAEGEKREITFRHVLTMSGGLEWLGGMLERPSLLEMMASPNWVDFALGRPMKDSPGKIFTYNTGGSHLLSAILERMVGEKSEEYAKRKLFYPLGVKDWYWQTDPQGINIGGAGLWLTPRDMAKFGYLFLRGGAWENRAIVPEGWASESVRRHIEAGGQWLSDGYGYHWWVDGKGYYMALGFGGQFIVVVPERDLILVTTSSLTPQKFFEPERLLNAYIVPASKSSEPLPPNQDSVEKMKARISAMGKAESSPIPPLPPTAARISGKTFVQSDAENGASPEGRSWKMSFTFAPGKDTACINENGVSNEIGLDGLYRSTDPFLWPEAPPFPRSALDLGRGRWLDESRFQIEHFILGDAVIFDDTFTFEGDSLTWQVEDHSRLLFSSKRTGRLA